MSVGSFGQCCCGCTTFEGCQINAAHFFGGNSPIKADASSSVGWSNDDVASQTKKYLTIKVKTSVSGVSATYSNGTPNADNQSADATTITTIDKDTGETISQTISNSISGVIYSYSLDNDGSENIGGSSSPLDWIGNGSINENGDAPPFTGGPLDSPAYGYYTTADFTPLPVSVSGDNNVNYGTISYAIEYTLSDAYTLVNAVADTMLMVGTLLSPGLVEINNPNRIYNVYDEFGGDQDTVDTDGNQIHRQAPFQDYCIIQKKFGLDQEIVPHDTAQLTNELNIYWARKNGYNYFNPTTRASGGVFGQKGMFVTFGPSARVYESNTKAYMLVGQPEVNIACRFSRWCYPTGLTCVIYQGQLADTTMSANYGCFEVHSDHSARMVIFSPDYSSVLNPPIGKTDVADAYTGGGGTDGTVPSCCPSVPPNV